MHSICIPLAIAHTWDCLLQAPAKDSKQLFLQFAALEETYGLARSAMEVYDKAVRTVIDKDRFEVYTLYLARATQFFGVGKVTSHTAKVQRCASARLRSKSAAHLLLPFGFAPVCVFFGCCCVVPVPVGLPFGCCVVPLFQWALVGH